MYVFLKTLLLLRLRYVRSLAHCKPVTTADRLFSNSDNRLRALASH